MAGVPSGGQNRNQTNEIHACTPKAQVFQPPLVTEWRIELSMQLPSDNISSIHFILKLSTQLMLR